jgi:hypothetical protein
MNGFFKRNWLIYLLFKIEIDENKELLLQNKMQFLYHKFIFFTVPRANFMRIAASKFCQKLFNLPLSIITKFRGVRAWA